MQVLLVTAVLAGMATMMLRASLSRTSSVRQTRQSVSSELVIESCQAQVNMMWSKKKPEVFKRDLAGCWMNCNKTINMSNVSTDDITWDGNNYTSSKCHTQSGVATRSYTCEVPVVGGTVNVTATFKDPADLGAGNPCELTYTVDKSASEKL